MTEAELSEFKARAERKRDDWSEHWRQLCEERGNPVPKRRPGTFKFKATPNLDESDPQD